MGSVQHYIFIKGKALENRATHKATARARHWIDEKATKGQGKGKAKPL